MINKLKLGLDISKIDHIISRKMDAAVISSIDDKLTVSQAYVIDFIFNQCNKKEIFQKDLEKEFDLKRSSISLMLNNMEKSDLIKRCASNRGCSFKENYFKQKSLLNLSKNFKFSN